MSYDNRATILACALELFAERGYDAVGVQEICVAAGITKPTLYHYFGSKNGLLATLLAESFAELIARVEAAAAYHGDLPLTLAAVTRTYFEFARQRPVFYRMQLAMHFAPPESEPGQLIHPYSLAQHNLLETLFCRAADDHGNMRGRQQRYAVTLRGMIDTYIGLFLNGYIGLDESVLVQAVHQFSHGIYS